MLRAAPDALRADMQRFYGLDLDQLGDGLRVRRAADLAANLPQDAAIWRRLDPRLEWDTSTMLLAQAVDSLDFLAWTRTRDSQRKGARWRGRLPRPWDTRNTAKTQGMTLDETDRFLSMPRTPA